MTPQEKAKDKRLRKEYFWTLEMYNALGELQAWKCAICGKPLTIPNVDHEHPKIKIERASGYDRLYGDWVARTVLKNGKKFETFGKKKVETLGNHKAKILPFCVRGLLCPGQHGIGCNTRLGRADDIPWLRASIKYLEDPPAKKILNENWRGEKNRES
jgi:hypothetical protein